ncbi:MAG TPA: DUF4325 domain-containing protein [Solirubrobacteraceae bacterium]|jgi:hypothetical protein|nr:DUF4325 domain-containing protein [Solirubrobacteraceae bacterium]
MALQFNLREFGTAFATRERGAEMRHAVLARIADERAVVLDFSAIENVSYSFADEFVGKLAAEREDLDVQVIHMVDSVAGIISTARERRASAVAC